MVTDLEQRDRQLFDRIAEKYCAKNLHPASRIARRARLAQSLKQVPLPPNPTILEVGCGVGFSAPWLEPDYTRFVGIDHSEQQIRCAHERFADERTEFHATDIKAFDSSARFDLVFMIGVLHHIEAMQQAVESMAALTRPGGWILVNEPHPGNPLIQLLRKLRKRADDDYSDEQVAISRAQLTSLFTAAGLEQLRIRPQGLFSTPFAEVMLGPTFLTAPLAALATAIDAISEATLGPLLHPFSWNLVAAGRKPST